MAIAPSPGQAEANLRGPSPTGLTSTPADGIVRMRFEYWLSSMNGPRASTRRRRRAGQTAGERLEPRIALGDVAFALIGLSGLPDLLAPPTCGGGTADDAMRARDESSAAVADRPANDATFPPPAEQPPSILTPPVQSGRAAAPDAPARRMLDQQHIDADFASDLFDEVLAPLPRPATNVPAATPIERDPPPDTAPNSGGGGGGSGGQDAAAGGGGDAGVTAAVTFRLANISSLRLGTSDGGHTNSKTSDSDVAATTTANLCPECPPEEIYDVSITEVYPFGSEFGEVPAHLEISRSAPICSSCGDLTVFYTLQRFTK